MSLEGSWISICWEMQSRHYVDRRYLKILSPNMFSGLLSERAVLYSHKTLDLISTSMHKNGSTKTVYCSFIWFLDLKNPVNWGQQFFLQQSSHLLSPCA